MNADRLFALYNRVAEAPDAVSRLRRFVLDLAVHGKLVEQDPADEPASELLKRVSDERKTWLRAKRIKRVGVDPIALGETPFPVPSNWEWTRLGNVGDWSAGSTPSRANTDFFGGDVTWLKSGELNDNRHLLGSEETITQLALDSCSFRMNRPGDVLIAMYGATIGKLAILAESAATNQAVCGCTPFQGVLSDFLFLFLLSQRRTFRRSSEGGAQPNISKVKIVAVPFPLPPFAEQHRIVAKVDELMGLCDRLDVARADREDTRDRLTKASLARLNASETDAATFRSHTRFAIHTLPAMTARADQVKQLRQTIFHLAVRGKLVRQDPADEPASELLTRIAEDKKTRGVSARDRRQGPGRPIESAEMPFRLPTSWVWVSLGDITISRDRERVPVSKAERKTRARVYDYYGASGVIDKIDGYLFDKPLLLLGEDGANLINRSKPIAFIARGKYWVNNHAHVLDGLSEGYLRFLELFINATDLKPFVTGTAQPKMNQTRMNSIPVALPPLSEQHCIVAKVDELMALCDRLEAELGSAGGTRNRLLESLLQDALTSSEYEPATAGAVS